jgi:hypothetical protein
MKSYYGYTKNNGTFFAMGNPEIPSGQKVIITVLDECLSQDELRDIEWRLSMAEKTREYDKAEIEFAREYGKKVSLFRANFKGSEEEFDVIIAKNMLFYNGWTPDMVARCTGLSLDYVNTLKDQGDDLSPEYVKALS